MLWSVLKHKFIIWLTVLTVSSVMFILMSLTGYAIDDHSLERSDIFTGNFDPAKHTDFTLLPQSLSLRPTYIRKETLQAFVKLAEAANKDGIRLQIISAFRSYEHQKDIWDHKFKSYSYAYPEINERIKNIMKFSAIPGISRHHWGTDIDINSLNNEYFTRGEGKKVHEWLQKNAERYDFYLTYTFGRSGGYEPEMWHYTHYPSSAKLMKEYYIYMNPQNLKFFRGADSVDLEKVFYEYSFNINPLILNRLQLDGITIAITF